MTKSRRSNVILPIVIVAALGIAYVAVEHFFVLENEKLQTWGRNVTALEFSLPVVKGFEQPRLKLSDLEGRPIFLHFWASWCVACRAEIPLIEQMSLSADLQIIAVASYDTLQRLSESDLLAQMTYPVVLDEDGEIAQKYRITKLPASFLLDQQGRVLLHIDSALSLHDVDRIYAKLGELEN